MKLDKYCVPIVAANLSHCIGLLDKDGINAKAKVKKELKRLLDTYFEDDEEVEENEVRRVQENMQKD